jgi:hypothetical protein
MLLLWEISLWIADIQTEADMGSVCMDQLQCNGPGGFRRTDRLRAPKAGLWCAAVNGVCMSKGPRALSLTAIGADRGWCLHV